MSANLPTAKFKLGQILATPNVLAHVSHVEIVQAISRHQAGDWGELSSDDWAANELALRTGSRLLSRFESAQNVVFWLITEADRSATTVLLPEDY